MPRFHISDEAYYISGLELVKVKIMQIIKTYDDHWLYMCLDGISEIYLSEQDLYTIKEKSNV